MSSDPNDRSAESEATRHGPSPVAPAPDPEGTRFGAVPPADPEGTRYGAPAGGHREGTRFGAQDMNRDFERIRQIFFAIVEQPPAQWEGLLNEACGDDPELHQQVAVLLQAHAKGDGILDRNQAGRAATGAYESLSERAGTIIGPYKLLQQIGEGGFGTVFMAEQQHPVRRKVALKVIKPGMDTRQVIARFEAERQALAIMDHVNIARVFDGGTTESGRPYFVMELVQGVPITKYCDDNHLSPRERLELFLPVCQAIQHAHQKGIIHRDIKPSNVMVTLYDGKPVPKVIDFGVAKATEQPLTESPCRG
jgi:hypothetical protein